MPVKQYVNHACREPINLISARSNVFRVPPEAILFLEPALASFAPMDKFYWKPILAENAHLGSTMNTLTHIATHVIVDSLKLTRVKDRVFHARLTVIPLLALLSAPLAPKGMCCYTTVLVDSAHQADSMIDYPIPVKTANLVLILTLKTIWTSATSAVETLSRLRGPMSVTSVPLERCTSEARTVVKSVSPDNSTTNTNYHAKAVLTTILATVRMSEGAGFAHRIVSHVGNRSRVLGA